MKIKTWLKYAVHNCIVHPVLPFIPKSIAHTLHDVNADWAFKKEKQKPAKKKQVTEVKTFLDELEEKRPYVDPSIWKKAQEMSVKYPINIPTTTPTPLYKPGQIICGSNY